MSEAQPQFDVFISYNSKDKEIAESIAARLLDEFNIRSWLDKWDLAAAKEWEPAIEGALNSCAACAIFLGAHGWGNYHLKEAQFALQQMEKRPDFLLIPTLLPGARETDIAELGTVFQRTHRVDFSNSLEDEAAYRRFVSALRGDAPGPPPMTVFTIRRDARRWELAPQQDKSFLYRGKELQEAQKLAEQYAGQLNEAAVKFLSASAVEEQRTFQAGRKRTRRVITTLSVLLLTAIVSAVIALGQSKLASEQRTVAEAQAQLAEERRELAETERLRAEGQTRFAEQQEREARRQEGIAVEERERAEQQTIIAEERRVEAERQRARAEEQTRLAEERARQAMAGQLALRAGQAGETTATSVALHTASPERSVLLALESLYQVQTPEGMRALRNALAVLTGVPRETYLEGEELSLSSAAGQRINIYQNDSTLVWDAAQGRASAMPNDEQRVEPLAASPNGRWLVIPAEASLNLWEASPRRLAGQLPYPPELQQVTFNSDSSRLLILSLTELRVIKLPTMRATSVQAQGNTWLDAVLSANGSWLATLDRAARIQVIEVATGRALGRPIAAAETAHTLAISADGRWLAEGSQEGEGWRVRVRVRQGAQWRIEPPDLPHEWPIGRMVFSPDARWLATVTARGDLSAADTSATALVGSTIRVWDLSNGRLVTHDSLAAQGGITSFAFTGDGRWLAATSRAFQPAALGEEMAELPGSTLRVWMLWPTDLIRTACSRLTRNLSHSEWSAFVGYAPYRKTCAGLPVPME